MPEPEKPSIDDLMTDTVDRLGGRDADNLGMIDFQSEKTNADSSKDDNDLLTDMTNKDSLIQLNDGEDKPGDNTDSQNQDDLPKSKDDDPPAEDDTDDDDPDDLVPLSLLQKDGDGEDEEEEPESVDDEIDRLGLKNETATAFRDMRTKLDAANKTIDELSKDHDNVAYVQKLEQDLAESRRQVATLDLTKDTDFQAKFSKPITDQFTQIARTAFEMEEATTQESKDEIIGKLKTAANLGLKDRRAFIQSNFESWGSDLSAMFTALDGARTAKAQAIENAERTSRELNDQRAAQQEEALTTGFDSTVKDMVSDGCFLLATPKNPKPEWTQQQETIVSNAKKIMKDHGVSAEVAIDAACSRVFRDLYIQERLKHSKTSKTLSKRRAAGNNIRTKSGGGGGGKGKTDADKFVAADVDDLTGEIIDDMRAAKKS